MDVYASPHLKLRLTSSHSGGSTVYSWDGISPGKKAQAVRQPDK